MCSIVAHGPAGSCLPASSLQTDPRGLSTSLPRDANDFEFQSGAPVSQQSRPQRYILWIIYSILYTTYYILHTVCNIMAQKL